MIHKIDCGDGFVFFTGDQGKKEFKQACAKLMREQGAFILDEDEKDRVKAYQDLGTAIGSYMTIDFEARAEECKLMIDKYLKVNPNIKPDAEGLYEWDITARKLKEDGK